jgi:hypothetical protein
VVCEQSKTVSGTVYEFTHALVNATTEYTNSFWVSILYNTTVVIHYSSSVADNPWVPPIYTTDGINATWYFRSDTWTTHSQLGYGLSPVQTSTETSNMETDAANDKNSSFGVKVWAYDADGDKTELTAGSIVAIAYRDSDGEGIQSATWTWAGHNYVVDAVEVRIYQRFNTDAWTTSAVFITKTGLLFKFPAATWTFNYFTNRTSGSTNSTFWYGSYEYNSRIELYYTELNPFETMHYHLQRVDLLAFFVTPWTYFIGDIFYGLLLLFISVTTYMRYHSLRAVLGLIWLFGGVGGVLTAFLPAVAFNIAWIFLAVALAITFVKLVR